MNSPKKLALPLVVALSVLTHSLAFGADDHASQQASSSPPDAVHAAPAVPAASSPQTTQAVSPHPKSPPPSASADAHGKKTAAADAANAPKTPVVKPAKASTTAATVGTGAGSTFAQSALDSVDGIVRLDEKPKDPLLVTPGNMLAIRMAKGIEKAVPVAAGTIDEQVFEDGRREERVHTLGGQEYCVTFESPTDPKDGIDKMQYGLHPGAMSNGMSMHTCGHRFDQ